MSIYFRGQDFIEETETFGVFYQGVVGNWTLFVCRHDVHMWETNLGHPMMGHIVRTLGVTPQESLDRMDRALNDLAKFPA